jgi:outer membrane protein assembly factor BamB
MSAPLSDDDNLYAFNAKTGATEWTYPTGGNTTWGIAATGSIVYADCQID